MDPYQIIQLRARIERLESKESIYPGSAVGSQDIWIVQTRKRPLGDQYPQHWQKANVFPCVAIERVFVPYLVPSGNPADTLTQPTAFTDECLNSLTDDADPPKWAVVHCPWYVPPGFKFLAWCDPTRKLFHAINPPDKLLVGNITGSDAISRFSVGIGLTGYHLGFGGGYLYVHSWSEVTGHADAVPYLYDGIPDNYVTMKFFFTSNFVMKPLDTEARLFVIRAISHPDRDCGIWVLDPDDEKDPPSEAE